MKNKLGYVLMAGTLYLSGYVPTKPKITEVKICHQNKPCKVVQRVASLD